MFQKPFLQTLIAVLAGACMAGAASADIPCPDSSSCWVTFAQGKDRLTIAPNGGLETFASNGITIHVLVRGCDGRGIPGIPAQEIVLFNAALYICAGGNIADGPTDINGHTTFTGRMYAGGCVENLQVYSEGIYIGTVPVKTNGPDHVPASPGHVDSSDLASFASRLGNPARYSICYDYNETGPPTVDGGDLAYFANLLGAACPP